MPGVPNRHSRDEVSGLPARSHFRELIHLDLALGASNTGTSGLALMANIVPVLWPTAKRPVTTQNLDPVPSRATES